MILDFFSFLLTYVLPFIIVISVLVFFHELWHSLAAKHVGVQVQQFSIGFPPRAWGKKVGETEYLLSWIPMGGYVRLLGQNLDDEDASDPRNYASKTILQRFYILVAGPAMNLLLALVVMPLVFMLGVQTPAFRLEAPVLAGATEGTPAQSSGFLAGDRILRVGQVPVPNWNEVFREATRQSLSADAVPFTVERGGRELDLLMPGEPFTTDKPVGWEPLRKPVVGNVLPDSAAGAAGLQAGDVILSINGTPVTRWGEIPERIQKGRGSAAAYEIQRGEERFTLKITPRPAEGGERWLIGISQPQVTVRHGPLESVKIGTQRLLEITGATFTFLGRLVTGGGSMDALGGPVKIGKVIGEAAHTGAANLVFLAAVISLQLGIFNLLPIPALDGGHIFMLAVEKVKGSPLSARLRERAQMVGFSLLVLLILIVTSNDILGLF